MNTPEWKMILDSFYQLVASAQFDRALSNDRRKQMENVKKDIVTAATFISNLEDECNRLQKVEQAIKEFTDNTFNACWGDVPLEEAHDLMFRERIQLQGKLAQLRSDEIS